MTKKVDEWNIKFIFGLYFFFKSTFGSCSVAKEILSHWYGYKKYTTVIFPWTQNRELKTLDKGRKLLLTHHPYTKTYVFSLCFGGLFKIWRLNLQLLVNRAVPTNFVLPLFIYRNIPKNDSIQNQLDITCYTQCFIKL